MGQMQNLKIQFKKLFQSFLFIYLDVKLIIFWQNHWSLNFNDLILIHKLPTPRGLNLLKLNYGIEIKSNFDMFFFKLPIFFMTKLSESPIVKNLTIGHSLLWSQSSTRQKKQKIEKQEALNSLKILWSIYKEC